MLIEPGVPMRGYTTRPPKYRFPLAEMEVGDSFFVAYGGYGCEVFLADLTQLDQPVWEVVRTQVRNPAAGRRLPSLED